MRRWVEESDITMPPVEMKQCNETNGEERSCWKINKEKNKLAVDFMENFSKLCGDKRPLKEAIDLSESTKAMKNFFHQEDRRKIGSLWAPQ